MKKKGFTLIELLVVIAIIAMLLAILMPALSKVKKIAQRVICGTNLKGLGTAMVVYANDYADAYPVQGRRITNLQIQTYTDQWDVKSPNWANFRNLTIGSSLYLLVREADVSPKSFVCPASDQKEFSGKNQNNNDLVDLWDFGSNQYATSPEGPGKTVSYAYHMPYTASGANSGTKGSFSADGSRSASFALMADKNPWLDKKISTRGGSINDTNYMSAVALLGALSSPAASNATADWTALSPRWTIQVANAQSHEREGQNVLFGDGHNEFSNRTDIGVQNDNIYTAFTTATPDVLGRRQGLTPGTGTTPTLTFLTGGNLAPKATDDSVLVNDIE